MRWGVTHAGSRVRSVLAALVVAVTAGCATAPTASVQSNLPAAWTPLPSVAVGLQVPGLSSGLIAFRTADGGLVGYRSVASASPGWTTVTSGTDGYRFDAPPDWRIEQRSTAGHDLFVLLPPGVDPATPMAGGIPSITVGWAASAPTADSGDPTVAELGNATTPLPGTAILTIGGLSRQIVAAIPRRTGVVLVTADVREDAWLDVFYRLLSSWRPA